MIALTSLWAPILLSAVIVFLASSIIHMVLGYHNNDFERLPQEDAVMDALRPFGIPPGDYLAPWAGSNAERQTPAFNEKLKRGPVIAMTAFAPCSWRMGGRLMQWFLFGVLISVFAGYVAGRTLPAGTEYLEVMRISGTVAFAGYALAHLPASIWYDRKWSTTLKNMFDGLVYALLTGGTFGWLWPN
jgi:hypothetical protein